MFKKKITDSETAVKLISEGYVKIWGDEFDGNSLNGGLWEIRDKSTDVNNLTFTSDSENFNVSDGCLNMYTTQFTDGDTVKYKIPYGVTTANTMSFQYGYLEMRAKISFSKGVWHSFWMQSMTPLVKSKAPSVFKEVNCLAEVDVFEIYNGAAKGNVIPNLHLWKWIDATETQAGYNQHVQTPKYTGTRPYTFAEISKLSDEFHTYGFLWTDRVMTMYVDGTPYITYNIAETLWDNLGSAEDKTDKLDEAAFHTPMDVILGCGLVTKDTASWLDESDMVDDASFETVHYNVDYVRLYQSSKIQGTRFFVK